MEVWKKIESYDGYEVSSYGQVKSLERMVWNGRAWHLIPERILKQSSDGRYLMVSLCKNNISKKCRVHKLVAEAFLSKPDDIKGKIEIDHIDNNKLNNNLSNLRYVNQRENTIKSIKKNKSSKYTGVCWHKNHFKWMSSINMKDFKKTKYFDNEYDAHLWYEKNISLYYEKI